jgi:hypothetical protein
MVNATKALTTAVAISATNGNRRTANPDGNGMSFLGAVSTVL